MNDKIMPDDDDRIDETVFKPTYYDLMAERNELRTRVEKLQRRMANATRELSEGGRMEELEEQVIGVRERGMAWLRAARRVGRALVPTADLPRDYETMGPEQWQEWALKAAAELRENELISRGLTGADYYLLEAERDALKGHLDAIRARHAEATEKIAKLERECKTIIRQAAAVISQGNGLVEVVKGDAGQPWNLDLGDMTVGAPVELLMVVPGKLHDGGEDWPFLDIDTVTRVDLHAAGEIGVVAWRPSDGAGE